MTPLQQARSQYHPKIAPLLTDVRSLDFEIAYPTAVKEEIQKVFSHLTTPGVLRMVQSQHLLKLPMRAGVVLSGGQAAGGHNVICAIFDAIKTIHPDSRLFGFLGGPAGIVKGAYKEITAEMLMTYRNQGGFDLIGSGRTKIETKEQFQAALSVVNDLKLDAITIIGGDDSNTNAAYLAEYFTEHHLDCTVVGVPKTIDGDLQSDVVEMSFGFDTACKTYAESIGNIARDALSNKKYYYFVKLMGRSASHITLECALQTQPNIAYIAEEVAEKKLKLPQLVDDVVELVVERSKIGKNYGVILIPEGLIEFLHDVKVLIEELNHIVATGSKSSVYLQQLPSNKDRCIYAATLLSDEARSCFEMMPETIQQQLLLDRDPHGNVQVSKIETDRLIIELVTQKLRKFKNEGLYTSSFAAQGIFCGYEGRSALPSNFDSDYCYNLGLVAAVMMARKKTGCMAAIKRLHEPCAEWQPMCAPIVSLLHFEIRDGKQKAVIEKTLVDTHEEPFRSFAERRVNFRLEDHYLQPGPIQFFGPTALTDVPTTTLVLRGSSK